MANNRLLVIYNICGIKKNNTNVYPRYLSSLMEQNFNGEMKVVISACMPHPTTKPAMNLMFPECDFNSIEEPLPINVTFNHSVLEAVKRYGAFDSYVYVSCDSLFPNPNMIQSLFDLLKSNDEYGMSTPQTDIDGCYAYGLKLGGGRHGIDDERARHEMFQDGTDYVVPIGRACSPHVNFYNPKILEFYGKLLPDIFAAYCTESIFTFLNAALKLKWVISRENCIVHHANTDIPSAGFRPEEREGPPWDYPIPHFGDSLIHVFKNDKARSLGLGYEECENIVNHDPSQFDSNGFCVNDELKYYLRDNVYLNDDHLNFKDIKGTYYECEG